MVRGREGTTALGFAMMPYFAAASIGSVVYFLEISYEHVVNNMGS